MKAEELPTHFAGFDWAKTHHDILVIDSSGNIVIEFRFEHTAEGWKSCQEKLAAFPRLAVAIEAGHANAIERLMLMGHRVYAVHPRSSKSYRARKRPSGVKTDRVDCSKNSPPTKSSASTE
jgi:transposase